LLICSRSVEAAPKNDKHAASMEHFETGRRAYLASDYQTALREFRESYQIEDRPEYLYNVARALESLGDVDEAIKAYSRYLSLSQQGQNRKEVASRIRGLEERRRENPRPV